MVFLLFALDRNRGSFFVGSRGIWGRRWQLLRSRSLEEATLQYATGNVRVRARFDGEESRHIVKRICGCQRMGVALIACASPSSAWDSVPQFVTAILWVQVVRWSECSESGCSVVASNREVEDGKQLNHDRD